MDSKDKKRSFEQVDSNGPHKSRDAELNTGVNKAAKITSSSSNNNSHKYQIKTKELEPKSLLPILEKDSDGKYKPPKIHIHEIHEARKTLRQDGISEFLNQYLPEDASGADLLSVIYLLGNIRADVDFDVDENDNLDRVIRLLRNTITRVLHSRDKLTDINTIEDTVRLIQNSKNIVVLTGAGISTSLGIPDFRSDKGLYAQLEKLGLSDPTDVFDLHIFRDDPQLFYNVAHMVLPPDDVYTPLHSFIKKLSDEGKLLRNYTQNIDHVESNAGIPDNRVIRCHGSFATATCFTCGYQVEGHSLYPCIREKEVPICPRCKKRRERLLDNDDTDYIPACFGVLKPDIVFFHEPLPELFDNTIIGDLEKCDLLIAIGTSLQVAPVSKIVVQTAANVPQILINRDPIPDCEFDVNLLGMCDDVAVLLSEKLGWSLKHENFEKIKDNGFIVNEDQEEPGLYTIKPKPGPTTDEEVKLKEEENKVDEKSEVS